MVLPENRRRIVRIGRAKPQHRTAEHRAPRGRESWLAAVIITALVLFGAPITASADAPTRSSSAPTPIAGTTPEPVPAPSPERTPQGTPQPASPPTSDPRPEPALDPIPEPSAEPTPESTSGPTPTPPAQPTPTPQPTVTLTPTPTPTPEPTPTPTLEPTVTPTPTPTPTPTEEPAPEPSDGPIPSASETPELATGPNPVVTAPTDGVARAAAEADAQAAAQASAQKSNKARTAAAWAVEAQLAAAARGASNRATAQKLTVERGAALANALTHSQTAQTALNTAQVDLESARASQIMAQGRVSLVHRLAVEASTTAAASTRSFAALARKLAQQQSGADVADVFLGGHSLGNMLDQLSTLDQLDHVTENIQTIQARAEADKARADKLNQQDAETRTAASTVSVDASQVTLDSATSDFEAAGLALINAASQAATAAATLATLDVRPITLTDVGQLSDQGWANPAHGAISAAYGPRPVRPLPGVGAFHYGTDIGASCKSPILAATSGTVRAASTLGSYGNWILIAHGAGVETGYAHLGAGDTLVAVGDRVVAGQQIASVGSTGLSTGCHTHIEIRVDGVRVNPQPFFLNRGVVLGS